MSVMAKKVIGVAVAVGVVGVALALYVADWATTFPPTVVASANPLIAGGGTRLTLQTVASVGHKYGSNPGLGLLPGPQQWPVGAQHDLQGARLLGRPRDALRVRLGVRAAQPALRRRCRGRSAAR